MIPGLCAERERREIFQCRYSQLSKLRRTDSRLVMGDFGALCDMHSERLALGSMVWAAERELAINDLNLYNECNTATNLSISLIDLCSP